jgi:hypothetical protein
MRSIDKGKIWKAKNDVVNIAITYWQEGRTKPSVIPVAGMHITMKTS